MRPLHFLTIDYLLVAVVLSQHIVHLTVQFVTFYKTISNCFVHSRYV